MNLSCCHPTYSPKITVRSQDSFHSPEDSTGLDSPLPREQSKSLAGLSQLCSSWPLIIFFSSPTFPSLCNCYASAHFPSIKTFPLLQAATQLPPSGSNLPRIPPGRDRGRPSILIKCSRQIWMHWKSASANCCWASANYQSLAGAHTVWENNCGYTAGTGNPRILLIVE